MRKPLRSMLTCVGTNFVSNGTIRNPGHMKRSFAMILAATALVCTIDSRSMAAEFIYVAAQDFGSGAMRVLKYDGSLSSAAAVEATLVQFASTNLDNPRGVTLDVSGNVYVSNATANSISKFNDQGQYVSSLITTNPSGLAWDFSGNLYASNYFNAGTVTVFNPQGQATGTIGSFPTLGSANGIAFDQAGFLYVANLGGLNVQKFNVSTGALVSTISNANISEVYDVGFSPAGNLYVVNYNTSTVSVFDANGVYQPSLSVTSNINQPYGITFDSAGNFYVSSTNDNTISKYNPSGTFQFKWSTGSFRPFMMDTVPVPVPEPSTVALAAIATGVFATLAYRRRNAAKG